MREKIKILVTDADYKHTLGAVRCLIKAGFKVDCIGSSDSLSRWSHFKPSIVYDKDEFCEVKIDKFLKFLSTESYDVLLPIGAKSVQLIARFEKEIKNFCLVPMPSLEKVNICLDKVATYALARQIGITVPKIWIFNSNDELLDNLAELIFPVVIKDRQEITDLKPAYASNPAELIDCLKFWGKHSGSGDVSFPVIQRYIKGVGCGFFALYQHGECRRIFMHQRIRETPPSGGASCCAISIFDPELMGLGKKLLDRINWHGVAMVEFKREYETGNYYLMEINPKFWGSLDLALESGVHFPELAVQMAMGKNIAYSPSYRVGLKFHWPLDGELNHILENPRAVFPVLLDCLNPKVKSNLWIDDPKPALFSALRECKEIVHMLLRKFFNFDKIFHRLTHT
jgi:predicted ATP-grasp superfamily ATP-dependent carboligase